LPVPFLKFSYLTLKIKGFILEGRGIKMNYFDYYEKKAVFYEGIFQRMELKYLTLGGKR